MEVITTTAMKINMETMMITTFRVVLPFSANHGKVSDKM
jgi:hypothetical protein